MKHESIIGQRYASLTVVSRAERIEGKLAWNCLCECGNEAVRTKSELSSKTANCGCKTKRPASRAVAAKDLEDAMRGWAT